MVLPKFSARNMVLGLVLSVAAQGANIAVLGAPARAANPAVIIPVAPLVSPASALTYYGTPVSPTPPANRDPIVAEAARSLRYDIDTIYAFVRDNIRLTPIFGLQKGARGVILDGYGTAFDQAQLMVDTLREADAVAAKGYNPTYRIGTISLTAAQFSAWTGISDATVAGKFLANGGIPATVSGSGASFTVSMLHVWVQATIGGTDYLFDPSYKTSVSSAPMPWQAQTGYNQATLLAAGGAGSATSVTGFSISNFQQKLTEYRGSLETYIASNAAGKRADAVVGGDAITAHPTSEDRRISLPYVTSTNLSWSGQIPDIFRTYFTVNLNGSSYGTFYADVEAGNIIGFNYLYNSSTGQFVKDGVSSSPVISERFNYDCSYYISGRPLAATPAIVSIDINHPYAANAGSYADRAISRQMAAQQCGNGRFFVSNDWGYMGDGITRRMASIAAQVRASPVGITDVIIGPTLANITAQYSSFLRLAEKVDGSVFQIHDLIGIHALDNVSSKLVTASVSQYDLATSPSMSFEASVSALSKSGTTASNVAAAYAAGLGLAFAEGAVPRQEADSVYDMSALSLITDQDNRATVPGVYTTYLANPVSSPSWSTVQSSLAGYPSGATNAISGYVTEGYSLLIPQRGALRQPPITVASVATRTSSLWEGVGIGSTAAEIVRSAFFAWHPSAGTGSVPDRIATVLFDQRRGSILKASVGVPIATGAGASPLRRPDAPKVESKDFIRAALDVDGRTGSLEYTPSPDLSDGTGDFPRSLSLQRSYSMQQQANYGFGMGWKSNWYQVATMSSDGQLALGNGGAQAVASALVSLQAIGDLVQVQDAQHLYAALQTAAWLADQTINNDVVVSRGLDPDHTFYRQASGDYVSAKADGSTLSVTGTPVIGIINRRLYFDMDFNFTDRDGSVRSYNNVPPSPSFDLSSPNLASGLTKKFTYMNDWTFANGIKINTVYDTTLQADIYYLYRVYNNMGAAIYVDGYDFGSRTTVPYCQTAGGLVYYSPAYPATISYRTSSAEVRFSMDAQLGWKLNGDPDGARCPAGSTSPNMTQIQYTSLLRNTTDPKGNIWPFTYIGASSEFGIIPSLLGIFKPSNVSADIVVSYGNDGNVRSFTNLRGKIWNYYSTDFRSDVVSPLQATGLGRGNATYYDQYGQAIHSVDSLLRTTSTAYDAWGRPQRVTQPEGNATISAYDARGNLITQTQKAKPGAGLADLISQTVYSEGTGVINCVNLVVCNKPLYSIDPRGFRDDYNWNVTTGMPVSLRQGWNSTGTACQISTGGGCPLTSFAYGTGLAGYDPYTGLASGTIYLPLSQTEQVGSGSSTTSYTYVLKSFGSTYMPMSGQTVKKLVPTEAVVDSGGLNLKSCYSYDDTGNVIATLSPRAGGVCP